MQQLINGIPDPWRNYYGVNHGIFYIPNTYIAERCGKWRLSTIAETCKYGTTTADGRTALRLYDSTANTVKLTYALAPSYAIPFSQLGLSNTPFTWTVAMWVYCGPEDFTGNITSSSPNTYGQYLGTFNFVNKTAYENHQRLIGQMRVHIGRGSSTTLSLVVGRYKYENSAWTALKTNKSTNLTLSKGWHLVYIKPQSTRSTLVWGIDDQSFTNVTSFFNASLDWTEDYYLANEFCVSCGNKTNNLPRGPYRGFKAIVPNTDIVDLYTNDNW